MKLIANTEYGKSLNIQVHNKELTLERYFELRHVYDWFLIKPLNLSMFTPCKKVEGKWIPIEEPDFMDGSYDDNGYGDTDKFQYKKDLKEYQQAKERVLFEGWVVDRAKHHYYPTNQPVFVSEGNSNKRLDWWFYADGNLYIDSDARAPYKIEKTIEDLLRCNIGSFLTLTPNAEKQIGINK